MANKKDKRIFQEAIRAELKNEGFMDSISGVAQGVANVPRGMAGQFRLGQVNNKLKKATNRMKQDWNQTKQYADQKAEKMKASKNQQVARFGHQVERNFQSIDGTMSKALDQLGNLAAMGSDAPGVTNASPQEKYSKDGTANFGMEQWIKNNGADPRALKKGNMYGNFLYAYLDILQKGVDPAQIDPRQLWLKLKQAESSGAELDKQTISSSVDEVISQNGIAPSATPTKTKALPPPIPPAAQKKSEAPSSSSPSPVAQQVADQLKKYLAKKRAGNQGRPAQMQVQNQMPPTQIHQRNTAPIPLVRKKKPAEIPADISSNPAQKLSLSQMYNVLPTLDEPKKVPVNSAKSAKKVPEDESSPVFSLKSFKDAESGAKKRMETPFEQKKSSAPAPAINDQGEIQIGNSNTGESGLYPSKDRFGTKGEKKKRPSAKRKK